MSTRAVSLGPLLAEGRQAEVYAWGEGEVVKLFRKGASRSSVEHEARLARAVHGTGLRVPCVGEVIEIEGRFGLVYERVDGPSMGAAVLPRIWRLQRCVRPLVELHLALHAVPAPPGVPSVHEELQHQFHRAGRHLPSRLREAALETLASLPHGDTLCHGDFHPFNIIMSPQGPVAIDWVNVMRGSPLADVARTWITFAAAPVPRWVDPFARRFAAAYRRRYLQLSPHDPDELRLWCALFAAARTGEGMPQVIKRSVAIARRILL